MTFNSSLPEWNKAATAPTQTKKDNGWGTDEKPAASMFNWFFNTTYLALQELQQEAASTDKAQMLKITNDTGDVTISAGVTTDDILAKIVAAGAGYRTFYGIANCVNNPSAASPIRGIVHFTSATIGYVLAFTPINDMYVNYCNGGTWTGWNKILTDKNPTWTNLTLTGGTTPFQTRTPRYAKISNEVIIEGEITAIPSAGITMATLPVGYRPPQLRIFKVAHNSSITNDGATIYVQTDGTIFIQAIANTTTSISLMGIRFFTS